MTRTFLCVVLSVLVPLTTSGCGAIFNGTTGSVSVRTAPVNARVHVDGNYVGNAPGVVSVDSTLDHIVTVESPGYAARSVQVKSKVNAGYVVLDCLLLVFLVVPGVLALIIDGATGAWGDATPEDVAVNLDPSQPNAQPATPAAPLPTAVQAAPTGCQYDLQCRDNRICQNGQCVTAPSSP